MTFDLPGLARQASRLMLAGAVICAVAAVITWLASGGGQPANRHEDAVIVLGALAAVQAVWWFGLTVWADLAMEES